MNEISLNVAINASLEKVWQLWTSPEDIAIWNNVDENWHAPRVENDLKENGQFFYRMEVKDGSEGFDHCGTYDKVINMALIEYTLTDGRKTTTRFSQQDKQVIITETFVPETETPIEMQRSFCQSILNNFKKYCEKT